VPVIIIFQSSLVKKLSKQIEEINQAGHSKRKLSSLGSQEETLIFKLALLHHLLFTLLSTTEIFKTQNFQSAEILDFINHQVYKKLSNKFLINTPL
jgi:hypothetical protein